MKSFKCSVFYCDTPLECGFVGNISIYGDTPFAAQQIWAELHSKGIVDPLIMQFSLEAWHANDQPRKVEKFSINYPQIYYHYMSDHKAMEMSGPNYQGFGNNVKIVFFDQRVMDLFLQELSRMTNIKETSVRRS